jgi:hypothetical protein
VLPDSIAHSCTHAGSVALARDLAQRLGLRPTPFSIAERPDAALAVAPTSERRHGMPGLPVVVLSRRVATTSAELDGRLILCGVRDEADAPAVATAGAIAETLGLPLVLVHVLSPVPRVCVPEVAGVVGDYGFTVDDVSLATEQVERLVHAAGIDEADADRRTVTGNLGRHCDRPVRVCPRHPAPAMRVREALGRRARNLWREP